MQQATVRIQFPSTAATTTEELYASWPHVGTWRIDRVEFAPATAVAVDGSNYTTATVTVNDGAAGSDVSLCSFTTNSSGGAAFVLKTTLSGTIATKRTVQRGYQIKVAKTHAGTGAILDGTFSVIATKVS